MIHSIVLQSFLILQISGTPDTAAIKLRHFSGVQYPWFARLNRLQGQVTVKGLVSNKGELEQVNISGIGILADSVRNSIRKWEFEPCRTTQDNCVFSLRVSFVLLTGQCEASENCPIEFDFVLPSALTIRAKPLIRGGSF